MFKFAVYIRNSDAFSKSSSIYKFETFYTYTRQKKTAPRITVQLPGRSQEICQFCLYWCKGMSGTAALHIVYNQSSKMR